MRSLSTGDQLQITMSPYYGDVDCTTLGKMSSCSSIDFVSLADVLRNGFVYPPYSIYSGVRLATLGFDPMQDLYHEPRYNFAFHPKSSRAPVTSGTSEAFVCQYHRLLCAAVKRSTERMRNPWLLQSGGKDSTSLAIALSEARPETACITYLGGREEDEVASARQVASRLGLHHEALVCDPGRAYDKYLSLVECIPLLTADFALLSYADLLTQINVEKGDGILDGLGSDIYFGTPVALQQRILNLLARDQRLPQDVFDSALVRGSFKMCFALSALQMDKFERLYPGSRFSNDEVNELLGQPLAEKSRQRLELFRGEIMRAGTLAERRALSVSVSEASGAFAKGLLTSSALGMRISYPFCDPHLVDWVFHEVPPALKVDPKAHISKVLVREHIAQRFGELPYVSRKGSFRFDLCGLAKQRFDQVHAFASDGRDIMPGAVRWLERNKYYLDNKYYASKFYLLAITLPWLLARVRCS